MQIFFVTHQWEPGQGPAQWRLRRFTDALISNDHSVSIAAPWPLGDSDTKQWRQRDEARYQDSNHREVTIRTPASRPRSDLLSRILSQGVISLRSTVRSILHLRSSGAPDLIVASVPALPAAFEAGLLSLLFRVPFVIDLRDAWPDLAVEIAKLPELEGGESKFAALKRASILGASKVGSYVFRLTLARASLIVTTSSDLSGSLRARGFEKVTTIKNSPAEHVEVIRDASIRRNFRARERELRIIYAGKVGRAQGISNAVSAVSRARMLGGSIVLRIVGDGAELTEVKALARELNANIEFVDTVESKELASHYQWCDIGLVHLQDWQALRQTIPSKLSELLSLKIPVLVSADGEPARIVAETEAGRVVPAMDSESLAKELFQIWNSGLPEPNFELIDSWLSENADPDDTSRRFVDELESLHCWNSFFRELDPVENAMRTSVALLKKSVTDPVQFARLAAQKIPANHRSRLSKCVEISLCGQNAIRAWILYLLGNENVARSFLSRSGPGRLRSSIAAHLLVPDLIEVEHKWSRSKFLWNIGEMQSAISLAGRRSASLRSWLSWKKVLHEYPQCDSLEKRPAGEFGRAGLAMCLDEPQSNPIRPLHLLTNSLPHTQSGYTIRSHEMIEAQNRAGLNTLAVTRLGYPRSIGKFQVESIDRVDSVSYMRLDVRSAPNVIHERIRVASRQLGILVKWHKPDVIHTTTNFENGMIAEAVANQYGIPWVYEARGELERTWLSKLPISVRESAEKSEYYYCVRSTEARIMKRADAVVVLSEIQACDLEMRGIERSKIWVIRNSVSREFLELPVVNSEMARLTLNLHSRFTIGTVSSLVGYEGIEFILYAVAELRARGFDVGGLIVGTGDAEAELIALRDELGLQEIVVFPGKMKASEIVQWYDAIDVFCVPRLALDVTRVVTPLKPLQAMARGKPVIVSDLPALTEITTDRGAGIAVEPESASKLANAVEVLMTDDDSYRYYSRNGRKFAEENDWDQQAVKLSEIYRILIQRPG